MGRPSKVTITLPFERGDQELEVNVEGMFSPGSRATYEDPGDDPVIEDVQATLDGKPFELSPEETERAADALMEAVQDGYFDEDPPEREYDPPDRFEDY